MLLCLRFERCWRCCPVSIMFAEGYQSCSPLLSSAHSTQGALLLDGELAVLEYLETLSI